MTTAETNDTQHPPPTSTFIRVKSAVSLATTRYLGSAVTVNFFVLRRENGAANHAKVPCPTRFKMETIELTEAQADRIIQMALEDRTTFDAIG